jgi:hypothetical protein
MGDVSDDRPVAGTEVQLTPLTRGVSMTGSVESADGATLVGSTLVVRPSAPEMTQTWKIQPGDRIEVFWRTRGVGLALPATVVAVLPGEDSCWQLRVVGPAEPSQRRQAVRADVVLPVRLHVAGTDTLGETVDLSEAGCRVMVDGWGLPPEPGLPAQVVLDLEDGEMLARARIVRVLLRGARWWISLELVDPSEQERDRLRRRVFQALREERARLAAAD